MATDIRTSLPPDTDALFRAWVTAVDDAIRDMGLVLTADTGQIDLATVTVPATSTYAGFRMYRLDDALQSTAPVFLRVEFGRGGGTTRSKIGLTVGSGTNGAGTLTGQTHTRRDLDHSGNPTTGVARSQYTSGSTARVQQIMGVDPASENSGDRIFWGLERTKDATGADTDEGVLLYGTPGTSTPFFQFVPFPTGTVPDRETRFPALISGVQTSGVIGDDVGVSPIHPIYGAILNPLLGCIAYYKVDIARLSEVEVEMYGDPHNYLALGGDVQGQNVTQIALAGAGLLMRWE